MALTRDGGRLQRKNHRPLTFVHRHILVECMPIARAAPYERSSDRPFRERSPIVDTDRNAAARIRIANAKAGPKRQRPMSSG